jgi:hypothetical protein
MTEIVQKTQAFDGFVIPSDFAPASGAAMRRGLRFQVEELRKPPRSMSGVPSRASGS